MRTKKVLILDDLEFTEASAETLQEWIEQNQDENGFIQIEERLNVSSSHVVFAEDIDEQLSLFEHTKPVPTPQTPVEIDWTTVEGYKSWKVIDHLSNDARATLDEKMFCGPEKTFPVVSLDHAMEALRVVASSEDITLAQKGSIRKAVLKRVSEMDCPVEFLQELLLQVPIVESDVLIPTIEACFLTECDGKGPEDWKRKYRMMRKMYGKGKVHRRDKDGKVLDDEDDDTTESYDRVMDLTQNQSIRSKPDATYKWNSVGDTGSTVANKALSTNFYGIALNKLYDALKAGADAQNPLDTMDDFGGTILGWDQVIKFGESDVTEGTTSQNIAPLYAKNVVIAKQKGLTKALLKSKLTKLGYPADLIKRLCKEFDDQEKAKEQIIAATEAEIPTITRRKLPPGVLAIVHYNEAQEAGRPNRNGRIYVEDDMLGAVKEAQKEANDGRMFALGGHPDLRRPSTASDVAGLIRNIQYNESTGKVGLDFHVLNTEFEGRNAAKILRAGGSLPISSRCVGKASVAKEYTGKFGTFGSPKNELTNESSSERPLILIRKYQYRGWDIVPGRQSVRGAVASATNSAMEAEETDQLQLEHMERTMNLKELQAKDPALFEALMAEATKTFSEEKTSLVQEAETSKALIDESKKRIEALEAEVVKLTPAPVAVEDPKVVQLREELEEMKRKNHVSAMMLESDRMIQASPYSAFKDIMQPMIISENNIPSDRAALTERFTIAENLIKVIGARYRSAMNPSTTPGIGVAVSPDSSELTEEEQARRLGISESGL